MESGAEKKTLTSSYLTLTIGGHLKKEIDAYVEYAHRVGRQEIDPAEVVRLMLWHFLETNEEFSAWQQDAHLRELTTTDTKELER